MNTNKDLALPTSTDSVETSSIWRDRTSTLSGDEESLLETGLSAGTAESLESVLLLPNDLTIERVAAEALPAGTDVDLLADTARPFGDELSAVDAVLSGPWGCQAVSRLDHSPPDVIRCATWAGDGST